MQGESCIALRPASEWKCRSRSCRQLGQASGRYLEDHHPQQLLGPFNPYSDLIHGDWFEDKGRPHHTGAVYLDGEWLTEAAKLDEVLQRTGGPRFGLVRWTTKHYPIWARVQRRRPQRATGRDQCSSNRLLPGKARNELSNGARLPPAHASLPRRLQPSRSG